MCQALRIQHEQDTKLLLRGAYTKEVQCSITEKVLKTKRSNFYFYLYMI